MWQSLFRNYWAHRQGLNLHRGIILELPAIFRKVTVQQALLNACELYHIVESLIVFRSSRSSGTHSKIMMRIGGDIPI